MQCQNQRLLQGTKIETRKSALQLQVTEIIYWVNELMAVGLFAYENCG